MNAKSRVTDAPWRDRPYLSVKEAAEIAVCSRATLYGAAHAGRIEFRRLGGRTLVPTASLLAYLDGAEAWSPSLQTKAAAKGRARAAAKAWEV